ncbi:MAG: DUF4132 domain-containing protein [bacterium]
MQTGWNDDGEVWQHLIMGVEADYVQRTPKRLPVEDRNVQDAFQALEFGTPKERGNAARFLEEHANKSASTIPALLDRELSLPGVPEALILRHLELSWLSRRRITPNEFRSTWAQPAMWCGSARCLLGVYNGYDELVRVFRIDEAGELVDVNDDTFDIPGFHTIGLVHPDELTRHESEAWSEVFSDYQLISPFEQFMFESTPLPLATVSDVRPLLEGMGWLGDDEGMTFRRPLYTLDLTIYLEVDPPCAEPSATRQIIALSFADGLHFQAPPALQLMRDSPERDVLASEWLHRLHRDVGV